MIRNIIEIDEQKCNGCGLCADACHEGAIVIENGKARLLREDYCDGLGDCLPACPMDAIHIVKRETAPYDEAAVARHLNSLKGHLGHSCPGSRIGSFTRSASPSPVIQTPNNSELSQWPVQIQLVPTNAPYFENANLLIAADCTAFAYGDFHRRFIHGRITLIGCPKLDQVEYTEKLTQIIRDNAIKSLTIVRMEVPCCGGLERAAVTALKNSGKFIPWQVVTISTQGEILE